MMTAGRVFALWAGAVLAASAWGAEGNRVARAPAPAECRACHISDRPTRENPALVSCPRMAIRGHHPLSEAPLIITLDELSNSYGPVRFPHRAHAEMAETGEGCYGCHHYNQARPIFKCSECHSTSRIRTDLSKPDLKGARHRQCVDCHLQWSHNSECGSCHARKSGPGAEAGPKGYPKAKLPDRIVYETANQEGRVVTFRHDDHVIRFGLKCTACHQGQTCASCHEPKSRSLAEAGPKKTDRSMDTLHKPCFSCHADTRCASCHRDRPLDAFDHARAAGWALNRFHQRLACQRCHASAGKFLKLGTDCESCHPKWQEKFEHRKTGLVLDETHAVLGCDGCHTDGVFRAPPACASCHAGRSYPRDKPGKLVPRP